MTTVSSFYKSLVYVIEGNIMPVSMLVLEMLGCIPKHYPRVGEFLEPKLSLESCFLSTPTLYASTQMEHSMLVLSLGT